MDEAQEIAAGDALRKFKELIKTDAGRQQLATHPEQAIGERTWGALPRTLQHFLKHLNPQELEHLNAIVGDFAPEGLLVDIEPAVDSSLGFATLCKF